MKLTNLIFACASLVMGGAVSAKPWVETIADVRARSDMLNAHARQRGAESMGKLLLFIDRDRHTCAILGRMLDRVDAIRDLEEMEITTPTPNMTPEQIDQMQVDAASLQTWAWAAEKLLGYTEAERIRAWNLDCVGLQGIPLEAGFWGDVAPGGTETLHTEIVPGYAGVITGTDAVVWTGRLSTIYADSDRRVVTIIQDGRGGPAIWRMVADCGRGLVALFGPPVGQTGDTGIRLPQAARNAARDIYCADADAPSQELLNVPIENAGVYADWWTGFPEPIPNGPVIEIKGFGNTVGDPDPNTDLTGLLMLDCAAGTHRWAGAASVVVGQPSGWNLNVVGYRGDPDVPPEVIRSANRLYCLFAQ